MRQRMEPAIERGRAPGVDIKRGTGGIVDVEFIAQILLLAHGHRRKGLRHANTRVVLERMIGERLLTPRRTRIAQWLREASAGTQGDASCGSQQQYPARRACP